MVAMPELPTFSLSTPEVIPVALGLLAFILALGALTARDQRSPYITNSAYGTSLAVLTAAVLSYIGAALPENLTKPRVWLAHIADVVLFLAMVQILAVVVRLRNRRLNFRDDFYRLSNYWIYRKLTAASRKLRITKTYPHDPQPWPTSLTENLKLQSISYRVPLVEALSRAESLELSSSPTVSVALQCSTVSEANEQLVPLAIAFLTSDCLVQYLSCARHPIAFIAALREAAGTNWHNGMYNQISAIDAYTPHFGFTDSVHEVMQEKIEAWGVVVIRSGPSYAGMHTASAKAFNKSWKSLQKRRGATTLRPPTLVIYEGTRELIDLESAEQYRLFLRHVIPSEQLWGGMLTVFVEFSPADADKSLLRSYCDVYADCQKQGVT